MARFSNPSTAANDLLNKMRELYATDGISPLLKIRLMGMLIDHFANLLGEDQLSLSGWDSFRKDLKSIDPDLHWLCVQHRDVQLANAKAEEILKRYLYNAGLFNQFRFLGEVRDVSLQRLVQWVGYANLANAANAVWKNPKKPAEVWVVRPSDVGGSQIILAAEIGEKKVIQYVEYIPGEPLFAPTDNQTTREHLGVLKQKYNIRDTTYLKWPNSWPINLRQ